MSPLLIPIVGRATIPGQWKVAIVGVLLVGIPEVFALIAVAVMGNAGYAYLKKCVMNLFRRYGPPKRVSGIRYRIGLGMFIVPLLIGVLLPYVGDMLLLSPERKLQVLISSDLLFVSSLFVLGGQFWDKLRGLFVHRARIDFPEGPS